MIKKNSFLNAEEKIRLLLSDIHSIKTIKMLYDMHSNGLAKAEVIVGDILDMLVAKKLYNGYTYQSRCFFYNLELIQLE